MEINTETHLFLLHSARRVLLTNIQKTFGFFIHYDTFLNKSALFILVLDLGPHILAFSHLIPNRAPLYGLFVILIQYKGPPNGLLVIFFDERALKWPPGNLFRCEIPQMVSWTSFSGQRPSNGLLVTFFEARTLK